MNDKWYLIRYKYNQLRIVIASLALLDIQYLLPKVICYEGEVSEHTKNEELSQVCYLISPYVFVKIPEERNLFQKVRYSPGVDNFVKFLGNIYPVHEKIIEKVFDVEHVLASKTIPLINVSNKKGLLQVNCYLNDIEIQIRRHEIQCAFSERITN